MKHRFSPCRSPLAIFVGAGLGAVLVSGFLSLPVLTSTSFDQAIWLFRASFVVAGVCWLVGLVVIAVPFWMTMHGVGRRRPKDAAILGAGLTFGVTIVLNLILSQGVTASSVGGRAVILDGERTPYGWLSLIHGATLLSIAGVAVAVAVWWISYPRVKPPVPPA